MTSITGQSAKPLSVREHSTVTGTVGDTLRATTPCASSSGNRSLRVFVVL